MKNFIKGFIVATLIFAVSLGVFATSKLQSIEVSMNPAKIYVEGELQNVDHFIYKGTTYVPLRALSEMLDIEVYWDNEERAIHLYRFEPREYTLISFAGIPIDEDIKRIEEYDEFFAKIQGNLNFFLDNLEKLDIANNPIDVDTFITLQYQRAGYENQLYMQRISVNYRVPIYNTLKALDNIELALIKSRNGGTPEQIRRYLDRAREHVDYIGFLGY